jgi:hypothetical protein
MSMRIRVRAYPAIGMDRIDAYGYSLHFPGDPSEHDGLDEYLQIEFPRLHSGWKPTYGRVSHYYDDIDRRDYAYLLSGDVPGASSLADAEKKVEALVHELRERLKLPMPKMRVWKASAVRQKEKPPGV